MKNPMMVASGIMYLGLSLGAALINAAEIKVDFDGKSKDSLGVGSLLKSELEERSTDNIFPQQLNLLPLPIKGTGEIGATGILTIKISIKTRGGSKNEELTCNRDSKTKKAISCRKKTDGKELTPENIDNLILGRLFPGTGQASSFLDRTKHSYTNCSGPELFHCVDYSYWKEECKNEWVCNQNGLIPDSCEYIKYCYNREVKTHECSVVGTCIEKLGPSGIPVHVPAAAGRNEEIE